MRDYLATGNNTMVQARLAKAVLAEVPDQFLSYMKSHKVSPPKQRVNPQANQPGAPVMPSAPMV